MDEIISSFLNLPFWIFIPALITGGLYFLLIFKFYFGWKKTSEFVSDKPECQGIRTSVIIAFRNEKENLSQLVEDLKSQVISKDLFEVVFIDDNSEDGSNEVLRELIRDLPEFILIKNHGKGKKQAIEAGIEISSGDFIVTTDADCRPDEQWLSGLVSYYKRKNPQMILGPVFPIKGKGFFSKIVSLEFFSLIASAAGSSGAGHPVLCNGANLAYPKNILKNFNDPFNRNLASGDDVFLLQNLKKLKTAEIHFLKSRKAIIHTRMPETFIEFWQQRVRWASKSKAYSDPDMIITGLLVLGMNFFIVFSLLSGFYRFEWFFLYFLLMLVKSVPDLVLLKSVLTFYKRKDLLNFFVPLQFVYPFYVIMTGFSGLISRKYIWKGKHW
jgi:cellulose synthase/poly-beta-1,6-N-acetylglucosamine synthase-like glycosyltransferase